VQNLRRITQICPKCKKNNTYDIIPEIPNQPEFQLEVEEFDEYTYSIGNANYYCMDCNYKWKKYRGMKPYERIQAIYAEVGGYPGPYSQVKVDFADKKVEYKSEFPFSDELPIKVTKEIIEEDIVLFLTELHKCDFLNWAEEYKVFGLVMDGTHWSVRIEYDTHCEIKTGSNHYPPKWMKFCNIISGLSGNEFC